MDVDVPGLELGTAQAKEEIHFSGGLRGARTDQGWVLFPVSDDPEADAVVFKSSDAHFAFATKECGARYLGACITYRSGPNSPPMDAWEFGARDPANGLGAADSWSAICRQAHRAGDMRYAEKASFVAANLRGAGLKLRDVSNGYHEQLRWALADKTPPGRWFSNAALQSVYANFHALASELFSARDHLAAVVGMHVGAPERINGLSRLEDWISAETRQNSAQEPMVRLILDALGSETAPGWLRRLGDVRNEMLHRVPMSANRSVASLVLEARLTTMGDVTTIRMGKPPGDSTSSFGHMQDPLIEFGWLSGSLELLCRSMWKFAKYSPELPILTVR
ncbi:hypothetical protein H1235_02450 [Pseudoxanthomonas sp. NC8]|nr:hypothetical protein H1235_02450 [Pseudoxanthomonas sp. NC8]